VKIPKTHLRRIAVAAIFGGNKLAKIGIPLMHIRGRMDGILLVLAKKGYFVNYNLYSFNQGVARPNRKKSQSSNRKTAIVIQGPVDPKLGINHYLNLIHHYRNIELCDLVVLSTWRSAFSSVLEGELSSFNIATVLNDLPQEGIKSNFAKQVLTTNSGIEKAISQSATHILKIRTDQYFFSPSFLDEIYANYLAKSNQPNSDKLVVLTTNSFTNRIYSISDFLQFGSAEAVAKYWRFPKGYNPDLKPEQIPESMLFTNFITNQDEVPENTIADYHRLLAKYFILVEPNSLGYYWSKYTSQNNFYWNNMDSQLEEFTLGKWLKIIDAHRD
jgi:hypothetical protein